MVGKLSGRVHGVKTSVRAGIKMYQYKAEVVRVIDGDTVEVLVDLGFNTHRVEKVRIVQRGNHYFNTQETRLGKDTTPDQKVIGLEAKEFAKTLLPVGEKIILNTYKDSKGKYGRFLASIDLLPYNKDFASEMYLKGYGETIE